MGPDPAFDFLLREGIAAGQFGGPIEPHGHHAMGFLHFSAPERFGGRVVDLGSGAGLPALVLAAAVPDSSWTLIERRGGRAELLGRAIHRLGLQQRVTVLEAEAAIVAWGELRGQADWVTARSFGPPAATAELGAPMLRAGGSILTSEPRDADLTARWPSTGLDRCGLTLAEEWMTEYGRYVRLERTQTPIDSIPRKGARKRPLF